MNVENKITELKKISTFDVLCLGINATVGSGIFLLPGRIAHEAGAASILAFLACGIILSFIALCYAELGSIYTRNGGPYIYAKEAFGPIAGFVIGWSAWITAMMSWGAVANAVSSYLEFFHPVFESKPVTKLIAMILVIGFGSINYSGIKPGAITVNIFTISKILPLLLFIFLGFPHISRENYAQLSRTSAGSFGYAVFLALWTLQGFEVTPVPAGESRNPRITVPIATLGSLLISTLIYVLIQIVAIGVNKNLAVSFSKPLADASLLFMGTAGAIIITVGASVSMIGFTAGSALGSPRYLSAMAEDGFFSTYFAGIHPKFHTPFRSIFLTTAITTIATIFLSFESLVNISNFTIILQYISTCLALICLRYKRPELERKFKCPAGVIVAISGCIVSLWLLRQVKLVEFIISCILIIVGLILIGILKFFHPKKLKTNQ